MSHTFELEIVTPNGLVVRGRAEETQIPGKNGYLGILPGHAPLITELAIGEISHRENGQSHYLAVAWGFAEVPPNRVTILAETAERAEEINVRRAEDAKNRAEERLKGNQSNVDCARAPHALRRASTRLDVAGRNGSRSRAQQGPQ